MQSALLNKSNYFRPVSAEQPHPANAAGKSLAYNQSANSNQKLKAWYEQAYAYYGAVISGAETSPDPKAWQGFLDQMEWASDQLGYAGPQGAGAQGFPQQGEDTFHPHQPSVPNGATLGPMGTLVWNSPTADITDVGGKETHDIWSDEVNLAVPSGAATVTSRVTSDTRLSPPEQVLVIEVTDNSTGSKNVYFVHDYEDAKVKIKSAKQKQVQDSTNGLVAWEELKADGESNGEKKDASMAGEVQADGSIVYEPEFAGEPIQFWANPGQDQTHVVYSDAKIATKPSDEVAVAKKSDGTIEVLVQHKDGSKDSYEIKKGYKVDIQANVEYVTVSGKAANQCIPEDLKDRVTLNGGVGKKEGDDTGGSNVDEMLDNLMQAAGLEDPKQVFSALQAAGYNYKDKEALKKAIESGEFPPAKPDAQLTNFFMAIDSKFKSALGKFGKANCKTAIEHAEALLKAVYPAKSGFIVSADYDDSANSYKYSVTVNGVPVYSFSETKSNS
ncbi:MAG: hypothetical protein U1F66_11700 [bacterium]